jgi:hypothetical protein
MKKIFTFLLGLFIAGFNAFGQDAAQTNQGQTQNPQMNTRVDNISYWTKMAKLGVVPFNPNTPSKPAQGVPTKNGKGLTDQMSTDIVVVDEAGVTQSENSVFVDPNNNQHLLNSNNSRSSSGFQGADYFNSADEGQTWTGSKNGVGGTNSGDPAACINLNGRRYVGFITAAEGQGISYSDNGTTWTPVTVTAGVTSPDLMDKNHLIVDNTSSIYSGNVYSAWTCFVSGNANNNDIVFSRSTNNGVSWSGLTNISNAIAAGSHNQGVNIQTGPAGQVYATWAVYDAWGPDYFENAIGFARSTNGGTSFTSATRINNNIHGIRPNPNTSTTNNTGKNMRVNSFPSMAVDVSGGAYNGNIYIVWSNLSVPGVNTGTNVSVYCMRSTDGGLTWGTPVKVNQGTSANDFASFLPWITCDPVTGKLYCVFYDDRNLGSTSTAVETWMAYSENGGATWTDIKVSDVSFTPAPIPGLASGYFGDYLGITARNNYVYPAWTDNRSGRALTYVSPLHFSDHCIATGGCDEYISNVTIGSINNSSACEGYQNFTALSTNIPVNSSATVTVTNGMMYSGDQCAIWVDWNDDGDFGDLNETLLAGTAFTATVAPPVGTTLGAKTMRVRITYTGAVSPCGAAQYGEVEDYTINVSAAVPNYWTGSFNYYWHNDQNWSLGHIPTATEEVYLTNAGYQPAWVSIYDEQCKNLVIQSGGTLQVIEKTLTVNGNVVISIGGSIEMTHAAGVIKLSGNWTESAGASGFTEGPGRVVFNGGGHQYVYGSENFNILEANMGAALRLNNSSYAVTCNQYDWTSGGIDVQAGTFTALDLADPGLYGTFWVNPGGSLNLTQDASQFIDLRGELHIFGGIMTVTGGMGPSYWPYTVEGVVQMSGGILDFKNNGIYLNAYPLLSSSITDGTIRTNGYFTGDRTDFNPAGGTIELYGSTDVELSHGMGSSFKNLLINKSAALDNAGVEEIFYDREGHKTRNVLANGVTSISDLVVTGNLTIQAGTLAAPASIKVAGNWTNSVGTAGFNEGTGKVTFNSSDHQYCYGETFNTLELNKPFMDLHIPSATTTTCQVYDWTSGELEVEGGTFIANDLFDNGIFGRYYMTSAGGLIELHQDAGQFVDLNGRVAIINGIMNVYGGAGYSVWPYADNAEIGMSGGVLDFKNAPIYIFSTIYTLNDNITGGIIRTAGGFTGERADFTPTAGTFEFYGPADVYLSQANGCKLWNVNVNKAVAKTPLNGGSVITSDPRFGQEPKSPLLGNRVLLSSDFTIANDLNVSSGSFLPNGYQAIVKRFCTIYGSLVMDNPADKLYVGTFSLHNLEFHAGSNSTLSAGSIYPASWVWSSGVATVNGGIGNTIYFTGSNDSGIQVDGAGTVFGNIDVNKTSGNFYLNSYPSMIELAGNFNLHAGNVLDMQNFTMKVHGIFTDDATSTVYLYDGFGKSLNQQVYSASITPQPANVPATGGSLTIDTDFNLKGLLDIADGSVLVHGMFSSASTSSMLFTTGSFIADSPRHADKGWEYLNGNLTMPSGLFELTHNSIRFGTTATTSVSGGILRTGGAFYAAEPGTFQPTGGVVELVGADLDELIYVGNGNYCHDFLVNRAAGHASYLTWYDLVVKNDLTIQSGTLNANGYDIFVGGNWTNNAGTTGFDESTGMVTFYGAGPGDILTPETFYNLGVNKTYAAFDGLELTQNVTITNDLHIFDGTMELNSPANLMIAGNLTINLNAGLNADDTYGPQVYVGENWTNNNVAYDAMIGFNPGNYSQVSFNGIIDQFLTTACPQENFCNLRIDKNAGKFRPNDNVLCFSDVLINSGMWEDNTSGTLHHTFYKNFTVQPAGGFLNSYPLNTVEFVGSQNSMLTFTPGSLGYFYNLLINKATGFSVNQVGGASCQYGGNLTVENGIYNVNGNLFTASGNVIVNDAGILSLPVSSTFAIADLKTVNVNSGGRINIFGSAANPVVFRANVPASKYSFNVNSGGTIAADYTTFSDMGAGGISVNAGGTIDPAHAFRNCTFRDGISAGTLLTINNSQTLTVRNAAFPTNAGAGASNVTKTLNSGRVYFVDFTGGFSGEGFDNDTWNLLDWVAPVTATPTAAPSLICSGSFSQLNITRTGGVGPFTYLWSPATGLSNPNIIDPVATPLVSTTYNVTVTDALGSTGTGSVLLSINPLQPVSVSIVASSNPVPPSTFVSFTATPVNGGTLPSYQWKVNGINVGSGSSSYFYTPNNNDHVSCVLTSNTLCPSGNPATSNVITMAVVASNTSVNGTIPSPMSLCFEALNTITVAGPAPALPFTVSTGASATMIAGVKISYLQGTTVQPGGYMHGYITTTNSYCGSLPPAMVSVIAGEEGIVTNQEASSRAFAIYPNPTTGVFTLQHNSDDLAGNVQVELFDMRGNSLLSVSYEDERNHLFTLEDLPAGLYFLKVVSGERVESFKLIVTR